MNRKQKLVLIISLSIIIGVLSSITFLKVISIVGSVIIGYGLLVKEIWDTLGET